MGILKNYEAIGAFITASNDAFNRLQPGFDAVCIVASVGHDVSLPHGTVPCWSVWFGNRITRRDPF